MEKGREDGTPASSSGGWGKGKKDEDNNKSGLGQECKTKEGGREGMPESLEEKFRSGPGRPTDMVGWLVGWWTAKSQLFTVLSLTHSHTHAEREERKRERGLTHQAMTETDHVGA